MLFCGGELADELLETLRRSGLSLHHFARALDGFGDARLVERLQDVIYGVYLERLYGVLIERRGKYDVRHFHFPLDEFLSTPKPSSPGICTSRKTKSGECSLIKASASTPFFSLADYADFRKAFQQEAEFVTGGLFVVDDDYVMGILGAR